jgi:parvulin-like peptidyl-prolyl isomerase
MKTNRFSGLWAVLLMIQGSMSYGQNKPGERTAVTVNGAPISEDAVIREADHRIDASAAREAKQGLVFLESARDGMRGLMRAEVIQSLVERALIQQQLAKDHLEVTEEEAEQLFSSKARSFGQTRDQALAQISDEGKKLDWVLERMRWQEIGIEKLYNLHVREKKVLSEAQAREMYEKYPSEYEVPEERRVSHILVSCNKEAGPIAQDQARQKVQRILGELKSGAKFEDLARKYSDDTRSKAIGGDRGFSTRGIVMHPGDDPFGDVAFAMTEIGGLSDVVEAPDGFHIIKLTGIHPKHMRPMEEVVKHLVQDYHRRQIGAFWQEFGTQLQQDAKIVYTQQESAPRLTPEQVETSRRIEEEINRQKEAGTAHSD